MEIKYSFIIIWMVLSFFISTTTPLSAQKLQPYNKALIWRGFEHKWTYNHRINRIGSLVSMQKDQGYCIHYSATGLGSDSTFATTYYSYVEAPNVYFKETEVKILVNGNEGDLLTKAENIYLDLDEWMQNKAHYDVLVNGFEVKSMIKSDQLQLLQFLVEDPQYTKETQQIYLTANFNLVTNCRTLECELFKDKTAYELTLHLLILGFDEDVAEVRNSYTTRNYAWDTSVEVEELSKKLTISGQKDHYPAACLGIKGLGIVLNEEHWLLELNNYVTPLSYNPQNGQMDSHINMKVVAWNNGMENFSVAPFKAEFAKRKSGFAMLDTNPSLIQFSNAKIKHGKSTTSLYWKGQNKSAEAPEAESIKNISSNLNFN
ncbi:hypothetical protein [Aureispira anguillae]|uniref:Uncharacterized protein n=1 Tax=Aureispira anguillae TaxID=2864201 RepID=A0A915YDV4_9BACT|nr:hypothetical protein [Aureispira anguillae]BDS11297.1 hypothetical protein AsAng_0020090 [Aureispira anguillae]